MHPQNKLLVPFDGAPLITKVVDRALETAIAPVFVVVGHDADAIKVALKGRPVQVVHNRDFASGLSTSVKAGVEALSPSAIGAMFLLGDMPLVSTATLQRLGKAFGAKPTEVVVPTFRGRRGNPVVLPRRLFGEVSKLTGDRGARPILERFSTVVREVEVNDEGILFDIDTPEALKSGQKLDLD